MNKYVCTCKSNISCLEWQRDEVLVQLQHISPTGFHRKTMVHIVYLAADRNTKAFALETLIHSVATKCLPPKKLTKPKHVTLTLFWAITSMT